MIKVILRGIWSFYFLLLVFFTAMGVASYFRYSTAGFDFEVPTEQGAEVTYYRVRWDEGSTWVGKAIQPVPLPNRPLDWFDPGGTFMDLPTKPRHVHWLNDWGFWWITDAANDPFVFVRYGGATASYWIGVPSSLFLLVIWLPAGVGVWRLFVAGRQAGQFEKKTEQANHND